MSTVTLKLTPALALLLVARLGPLNADTAAEHINGRRLEYPNWHDYEVSRQQADSELQDAYDACHYFLKETTAAISNKQKSTSKEDLILLT